MAAESMRFPVHSDSKRKRQFSHQSSPQQFAR